MLTGSKLSSLARKYVFYRPELNVKEGPRETKFLRSSDARMNRPTDRTQRVDGKNGVTCLVIMFTPRVNDH